MQRVGVCESRQGSSGSGWRLVVFAGAPVLIVGGIRTLNLPSPSAVRVSPLSLVGGVKQPWGGHTAALSGLG